MYERHSDRKRYFREQAEVTRKHVIPYISEYIDLDAGSRVLEVGCGEGGNLIPFVEMGCDTVGIDLGLERIELAQQFFSEHSFDNTPRFICSDIYKMTEEIGTFDIIILRDVIEHIPDQAYFMDFVKRYMNDTSVIFFNFPPWYNPFGGHQQICDSRFLSRLPYYHIFPKFIYRGILKLGGESKEKITTLMEIKETGISIERFSRCVKAGSFKIISSTPYFINPGYEVKFKMKPRRLCRPLAVIPFLRNFWATGYYCIISK